LTGLQRRVAGGRAPRRPDRRPWDLARVLEVVAGLGGAAGLTGALLYYFGWARSSALFGWFGVDVGVVKLSFQDYLLRSVGSAYWPFATVGVVALLALGVHRILVRARGRAALGRALALSGGLLVLVGLAAVARWITFLTTWPVVPTGMLTGVLLLIYGIRLAGPGTVSRTPVAEALVSWRLPVGVVLVSLTFWSVAGYATYRGVARAEAIAEDLSESPGVLVFSTEELRLVGSGVHTEELGPPDSTYRWCHSGLRLLIGSGGSYFLLPEHWKRGRDSVIVLAEGDRVRVEYMPTRAPTVCP
jgi:hypothetical protein